MSGAEPGTVIPGPVAIQPAWLAQPPHAPDRRHFSVLCHRGWCDWEFKVRAIAELTNFVAGTPGRPPNFDLPRRECPIPESCDHECHDAELGWPRRGRDVTMTGRLRRRWRRAVYWLYGGFVPDGYLENGGKPWTRRGD